MTLNIELDPELVVVYAAEAARRGVEPESVALEILRIHRPAPPVRKNSSRSKDSIRCSTSYDQDWNTCRISQTPH